MSFHARVRVQRVGGFNPCRKICSSNWIISPRIGVKKQNASKKPPKNPNMLHVWYMQLTFKRQITAGLFGTQTKLGHANYSQSLFGDSGAVRCLRFIACNSWKWPPWQKKTLYPWPMSCQQIQHTCGYVIFCYTMLYVFLLGFGDCILICHTASCCFIPLSKNISKLRYKYDILLPFQQKWWIQSIEVITNEYGWALPHLEIQSYERGVSATQTPTSSTLQCEH